MTPSVRDTFEALEPLDLKKCRTVGELVRAMSKCSFVARMIGEVAETICGWLKDGQPVPLHFSGPFCTNPLWTLADNFSSRSTLRPHVGILDPRTMKNSRLILVGRFSEFEECYALPELAEQIIFINREGLCQPGQVKDGYFPNVVFEDPRFVLPVISAALDEWLGIRTWTVSQLFETLLQYGGVAAEVVQGAKVLKAMVDDPDCTVFMTASGALTIAQLDLLFCDMIEDGMVQYLATTGALMAHGLVKGTGLKQYKHRPKHSDALYAEEKINRVTDTLEPEENFDHIDEVMNKVLNSLDGREPISPSALHWKIGWRLQRHYPEARGLLKSAVKHHIPVCTPAFVDSELGNDVLCHNAKRQAQGRPKIRIDPEIDSSCLMDLALKSKRLGIFSLGGGVPRNNTQNVAPLIEIYKARLVRPDLPDRQFSYGCRICPDPMWHGHLSGCTYSENESWRKMENVAGSGRFAEVHADATATWPFILKWVEENRGR